MANNNPNASFPPPSHARGQHPPYPAVHHDASFTSQTLPPLADAAPNTPQTEKHPKGKRKRTAYVLNHLLGTAAPEACFACKRELIGPPSAKDKMILEEAYSNNPKPDKQARLEIVQRVSLNEKEVQVRCSSTPTAHQTLPSNGLLPSSRLFFFVYFYPFWITREKA